MTAEDFKHWQKVDAHNHLNLGMMYPAYSGWAGFSIPDFPRKMSGLAEMHEIIARYTRPRYKTAQDVEDMCSLSIEEAIRDNVAVLEGSIDLSFVTQCGGVDTLLTLIDKMKKRYSEKIDFRPELGLGKKFDIHNVLAWAPECLRSGLFSSIDLYGPEVDEGMEDFKIIFELAGALGIKKKAHIGEFSDAKSVRRFVEFFDLDEVQHGIGAAKDDSVIQFLKDRDIRLNIAPESNVQLSAVPSLAEHPIKKFTEAGIRLTIGTDDLLFFNKGISDQCADLVNAGLLTREQMENILRAALAEYK